jgi:hypothetical protein
VATYSPAKNVRPGANNIPMSYAGPPSQEEINRNRNRHIHNQNYQSPIQENIQSEGFNRNRGGSGAVVMSYSPPQNRNNKLQKKQGKRNNNNNV